MLTQAMIDPMVEAALAEDIGTGDITAQLVDENATANAHAITREPMVFCGLDFVKAVFSKLDSTLQIEFDVSDGDCVKAGSELFRIKGNARAILTGERTALNFVQMLSGTATVTHEYVRAIGDSKTQLLDTRKTIPLYRYAQKYAVSCGGGHNHRVGLFDAFLIKENHIMAAGSIAKAIENAKKIDGDKPVEIEVEDLIELQAAIDAGADIVMLDNFTVAKINEAIELNQGRVKLEVSGNVTIDTIGELAKTGVDFISTGAITKHIRAVDLSMRFET